MADLNQLLEQAQNFDINDVDWDRVGVWPVPVRALLCLLAAALIVAAGYFFVVKDKNLQLEAAERQETTLRQSFERKAFEAANLDRYRLQMQEMEESFGALVSRLPSDTEVPGLLEDIDEKGVESRSVIESIELQPEVSTEFHIELPIKIKISGGYHEFGAFVSGVAGMPRIVTLHDFTITKPREDGPAPLNMDIIARTYRYKSQDDQ
ncbi:type 4a pilus biogenesis protein PilO [Teredinibacter turnerae]|uniref:Type 4 fimbrial biogenesis protein PilO n=1 Tax=Teredinibacter turnerae (strain ATCC 39867 / T7901) TaxID=377629 RepID=C5BRK1_TERTT|nr:type 4a pilus biogenesis protein PilO [Teredinibacter turnerae]ACR12503.1 type 4 fimbrial biogenesis protein PilO [Teredinibacter turnerae T7901]